ncbi:MAG: cytochrome c oxidase subunit II [Planctomycetia bacterium]|nr:cytochrome c oxidase subunit II [Planctomycetia bacterium]
MLWPEQASTIASQIDTLFWFVTAVGLIFSLIIGATLVGLAIQYRRQSETFVPTPVHGSTILELAWSIIPLGLVMVMFFWGLFIYVDYNRAPENAMEVYVTGKQWMWHLQHVGGQREINTLHIPTGRPVRLIMTSEDVIHDFYVPAFRVKMDVVPGKYSYLWFEATKPGTYDLFCAAYCGTEHSRMIGKIVVMEPSEFDRWLTQSADRSLALQGRQLFQKLQCITCHHPEANNRAPILEGLYGKRVQLEDGTTVLADEAYIRESILYPKKKIRAGWKPIMPTYDQQVTQDELIRVIAYLKGLKQGETPPLVQQSDAPAVKDEK